MADPAFKVQLFRFVDVFPTLRSPEQIHDYLVDYLSQPNVTVPPALAVGLKAGGLFKGTLAKTVASQIESMAGKFIAGRDVATALPTLRRLWDDGVAFSVDLLGEACVGDDEAAAYQQRYRDLIEQLAEAVAHWPAHALLESDARGAIPRANVSIKVSSLYARANPIDFEGSLNGLFAAVEPLLQLAGRAGVFVNFDMEQSSFKDLTIALFQRCCERVDFPAGLAMQAYLRSADHDVAGVLEWHRRVRRPFTIRLIKGAYWDYETVRAEQLGWPSPVWQRKPESDACFERLTNQILSHAAESNDGRVRLAVGTHNVRSIAHAVAVAESLRQPIELQMLHGMADELKAACVARGLRVREYLPVGEMIPGMAYLVRRLLENTSNESWLKAGFADNAPAEMLLADPAAPSPPVAVAPAPPLQVPVKSIAADRQRLSDAATGVGNGHPFFSEPIRDFSHAEVRDSFATAIAKTRVKSIAIDATVDDAANAVARAGDAFKQWRNVPQIDRSNAIVRAAGVLREHRDDLAAIMIHEAGKTWAEADADVCEAIDFCEYYARQAVALFSPQQLGHFAGELNEVWYEPRGVCAVISPWNFPLAICCGMTVAALMTGNIVVLKPAEQAPAIALRLCEALWAAGVPQDVLQFLPGRGETVGAALVRDPRVTTIAFTGSSAVGLDILRTAAEVPAGQGFVKRVVCEMGGKNAIIVDESADLDEAVLGVRQSAFGFAGQKCSAASKVVVLDAVHDAFVRRLIDATRSLVVGDPRLPGTDVGPLIDADAAAKVRSYIEIGRGEATLAYAGVVPADDLIDAVGKPFVGPHIFTNVRSEHRIAREEIFGPVLAVLSAKDFDEALSIANGMPFKLTGGVFTRKPSHIERARREFLVGDLYINRGITGALVGRQPFGGMGLSGIGAQAGGADYLRQFVNPRAVSENTMRRGFAPNVDQP